MNSNPCQAGPVQWIKLTLTITCLMCLASPFAKIHAQTSVEERLESARVLRQTGKSPEAIEIYDDLKNQDSIKSNPKTLGDVWKGLAPQLFLIWKKSPTNSQKMPTFKPFWRNGHSIPASGTKRKPL